MKTVERLAVLLAALTLAAAVAGAVYLDRLVYQERFPNAAWWTWLW
jgi:hypothetical protein